MVQMGFCVVWLSTMAPSNFGSAVSTKVNRVPDPRRSYPCTWNSCSVAEVTVRINVDPAGTFTDVTAPSAAQLFVTVLGFVGGLVVGGAVGATVLGGGFTVVAEGTVAAGGTVVTPGFNVVAEGTVPPGAVVLDPTAVDPDAAVEPVESVGAVGVDPVSDGADTVDPESVEGIPVSVTVAFDADPSGCTALLASPEPPQPTRATAPRDSTKVQRRTNGKGVMVWLRGR